MTTRRLLIACVLLTSACSLTETPLASDEGQGPRVDAGPSLDDFAPRAFTPSEVVTTEAGRTTQVAVGAEGARIGFEGGPQLDIPAGALGGAVMIEIRETSEPQVAFPASLPVASPGGDSGGTPDEPDSGPDTGTEDPEIEVSEITGPDGVDGSLAGQPEPEITLTPASPVITLTPHGTTFSEPVTLSVPLTTSNLPSSAMEALAAAQEQLAATRAELDALQAGTTEMSSDLEIDANSEQAKTPLENFVVMYLANDQSEAWEQLDARPLLNEAGEIEFPTTHFSSYTVVYADRRIANCRSCSSAPEEFVQWFSWCRSRYLSFYQRAGYGRRYPFAVLDYWAQSRCAPELPCVGALEVGRPIGTVVKRDEYCTCGYSPYYRSTGRSYYAESCSGRGTCEARLNQRTGAFDASCSCYGFNWWWGGWSQQSGLYTGARCERADHCPRDAAKTSPGVCGCGRADTDTDSDGQADCRDACPEDPNKHSSGGLCGCGVADVDRDRDRFLDCREHCPDDRAKQSPGACGCGTADTDRDRDRTPDCLDACPSDPRKTLEGACGCGVRDTDSDADGTADCNDACPSDPSKTAAGACGCGVADTDTDADQTADCNDACPSDPSKTAAGVCGCGVADTDGDNDGTANCSDGCPDDPNKSEAGACGCGVSDADSDSDGTADCDDGCPNDANKTAAGVCGCGVADTDSDGDQTADCSDGCPSDANKTAAGVCGCGVSDVDSDSDGTADCDDACPDDTSKLTAGVCGCGVSDADSDGDGTADCNDACPDDGEKVEVGQCGCGIADTDTDGDQTADCNDLCPEDGSKVEAGQCGCGVADTDTDGDGVADCIDACPNDDGKSASSGECGCGVTDSDSDGDGTLDCNDACPSDPDKTAEGLCGCGVSDVDSDGDGSPDCTDLCPNDPSKTSEGVCGCGVSDTDSDSDGTLDCIDGCSSDPNKTAAGICGCGVADTDGDSDGSADCIDGCSSDPNKTEAGQCGCGVADTDSDSDATADCIDGCSSDPNKTEAGQCGCGVADTDSDADGAADCIDGCSSDPNKTAAGVCGCGVADTDSDADGTADCIDGCSSDPSKTEAGQCGCGVADTDSDSDATADCIDGCSSDPNKTAEGVCGCGVADTDSDSDGTADCNDACPNDGAKTMAGICGCGVADTDTDSDGTADCNDACASDPAAVNSPCPVLPAGVVHCWAGEANGGDSASSNDMTVNSDVTYAAGVNGQAFHCSGVSGGGAALDTNANAEGRPTLSPTGEWTYEFWVDVASTPTDGAWILDRSYHGFSDGSPVVAMHVSAAHDAYWLLRNDAGSATIQTTSFSLVGGFHHVALTRGGGQYRTYLDGSLVSQHAETFGSHTPDPTRICGAIDTPDAGMVGEMDTLRIWDRALSDAQIAFVAAGDRSCSAAPASALPVTSGLAAHYDARVSNSVTRDASNNVSQWYDLSGNARHLSVNGETPVYADALISGNPALDFGALKRMATAAFPLTSEVTVFAVFQQRSPAAWGAIAHHGSRDTDWSLEQNALTTSNVLHFQSNGDNAGVELSFDTGENYVVAGRITGSTRHFSQTSTAGGPLETSGSGVSITTGEKVLYVGASEISEASNAYIGEIIYYDRSLSDAERNQIIAHLRSSWGIDAVPRTCADLLQLDPSAASGVHTIDPDGAGLVAPFDVYCDMDSNGGGWTLIGKHGTGTWPELTQDQYVDLIVNPVDDVGSALLLDPALPASKELGFLNREKTNALYHATPYPESAVRVIFQTAASTASGTYFQQRRVADASWDFWHAMRDARRWSTSAAAFDTYYVSNFGVDFVLTRNALSFDSITNTVTHDTGGDLSFGFWDVATLQVQDGFGGRTALEVSRHFGLMCDGVDNEGWLWMLTSNPTDERFQNDVQFNQSTIWLR